MSRISHSLFYHASKIDTRLSDDMHVLAGGTLGNINDGINIVAAKFEEIRKEKIGGKLNDINQINNTHVAALVGKMQADGASNGYIQNVLTALRHVLAVSNNNLDVLSNTALGVATRETPNIKPAKIADSTFSKLENKERFVFATGALRLSQAYGLRIEEAVKIAYKLSKGRSVLSGGKLQIKGDIGKNGKSREIPLRDGGQVLRQVAAAVNGRVPAGKVESSKNTCEYLAKKASEIQHEHITPHSLRHQYACERFVSLTGVLPPAFGGSATFKELKTIYESAMKEISQELGHNRLSVVAVYLT